MLTSLAAQTLAPTSIRHIEVLKACAFLARTYGETLGIDWRETYDPGETLIALAWMMGHRP